ncbi:MAG TPA: 16S rRNA (cytosine(967)-C(5))-methyltransferase RsmB [Candidatus Acidoferrum sp.]|jgi:16S rRNA (cytosine967-C5)-methyltransferase|nr:16S rRNA (cytosine(967)-C(5))-methyltransferase RsmB [Candidatus Acidoferrum sp.]
MNSFSAPAASVILEAVKPKSKDSRPAVSPARAAAFDILIRIERESSYATELLHSRTYDRLTEVDHSLTTELVMGVLRWRSVLDFQIGERSSQPLSRLDLEILTALRLAVYQLRLSRIPIRAAINESVELVKRARKRSAAPFVNAVLRKLATGTSPNHAAQPAIVYTSVATLAAGSAHPLWMVERWTKAYGLDSAVRICRHNQSVPVTGIRIRGPEAEAQLRAEGIDLAPGVLLASARRVEHGDVTRTAAFRAGLCVIQDEASQLVAALVGQGTRVLDCCAAPGGKTAAIADRNPNANVTAVDLHPHRARLLRRLLGVHHPAEAGPGSVRVVAADARNLPFAAEFDRVLADVPCSGTGTLARNPEIKWRLTPHDLADLQVRQVAILRSAMARVAQGGRLIYSTCSLEREENEDVIKASLADDSSFCIIDCRTQLERLQQEGELVWTDPSSLTRGPYLRTLPGLHPCDGFFAAILEKY